MMTLDRYDILTAFAEARTAAPEDRTLLRTWTMRYPQFAEELITLDFARTATGMTLTLGEDAAVDEEPEDAEITAMGQAHVRSQSQSTAVPLTSLITAAEVRGLDVPQFARALRLDRLLLSRLEQRTLDAASIPLSLVHRLAQTLGRSTAEVAAYLRARPRLPASAHFKAQRPPSLVAEAGAPRPTFAEALQRGQNLADDDRAYWQSEIEAGVLGDE